MAKKKPPYVVRARMRGLAIKIEGDQKDVDVVMREALRCIRSLMVAPMTASKSRAPRTAEKKAPQS